MAAVDKGRQLAASGGVIRIRLHKDGAPFGFRVAWCLPPRVEAVHPGSPAARAGLLPGDRLLSASGVNFSDLTEDESIELLREAKEFVELEVWRDVARPNSTSKAAAPDGDSPPAVAGSATEGGTAAVAPDVSVNTPGGSATATPGAAATAAAAAAAPVGSATAPKGGAAGATSGGGSAGPSGAVAPRHHLGYAALLHALVTTDQALIGRLLAGPLSGFCAPSQQDPQINTPSQQHQQSSTPRRQLSRQPSDRETTPTPPCVISVHPPEEPYCSAETEERPDTGSGDRGPALPVLNSISPEQQQAIVQCLEQIIAHVDGVADEVMRSMVSEDNGFSALRIFYRNLETNCELFREYFSVLEGVLDDVAGDAISEELSEFLQVPAQYLRKRLKILRRLRGLSSATEAHILQTLIAETAHVLEPSAAAVTEAQPEEEDMLVSQPQLTYMKGIQPVSLSERRWVHAEEVLVRRGRQWRSCYLVLLSDLLLVTQRNRQLVFVTEPPILLSSLIRITFNVKKKETDFQLTVPATGAGSRKPRCLAFRAPSLEAKLAWEDQVHKQISLMKASQSSGSLASQRSVSCDAIIETYKFGDLKPAGPDGGGPAEERGRGRSTSPPASERRLSTSSGSCILPTPAQKRPRPDTLRARLFGAPGRPRPLGVKKLSASAKCSQYLNGLTVPTAGERGRVTPVFEREGDMTIADFVKKRQQVLFDVQSADSADGAFETFLLDDEGSSESVSPSPPGARHVSYGCVSVVRYRGPQAPPPRRCRPQYNPYLDDHIEEDYPELVGAPVRRPSLTPPEVPEVTSEVTPGGSSGAGGLKLKRGLLPSPSMKFADDDDLSPTGRGGGLPSLRTPAGSSGRTVDHQANVEDTTQVNKTHRVSEGQQVSKHTMRDCERTQGENAAHESVERRALTVHQLSNAETHSVSAKKLTDTTAQDVRESGEKEMEVTTEELNVSSESPVLELTLPVSTDDVEPMYYEICASSDKDSKTAALADITHGCPAARIAGESVVPAPQSDASCHSSPDAGVRAANDRAAVEEGDQSSPRAARLERRASSEEHADQSVCRTSGSPGSQCSGFVDSEAETSGACETDAATDFTAMHASIPASPFSKALPSGGEHGKVAAHDGVTEEDRWVSETVAPEITALRDDVTELEDSAYLSRSDELLERHSQKVLSTALSSSLSSLARRGGSIPSSLDRSDTTGGGVSADPLLACRSEEVLPAFRCDDASVRGAGEADTLLTRYGTSCDLVSDVRHGYVPCNRRGAAKSSQRPYGQLVARHVAAFEQHGQTGTASPASVASRATSLGAIWQSNPAVRDAADLSPATPSSRGSYLTSGSPATSASACDLDSAGEDATLAPSSGDSQNSLFGCLPELEDEVAPDLTLELTDSCLRTQTLQQQLSDIEEMTEEMDGFISGSDILSPISEEASAESVLQDPSPPERESFLKPAPRKRQTQIQCSNGAQKQDHSASEHMRNKVRMWANGVDVMPYSGPRTGPRHVEDSSYRKVDGMTPNTRQTSVERALEIITDSFRGIGSEDQPDEEEETDVTEPCRVKEDEDRLDDPLPEEKFMKPTSIVHDQVPLELNSEKPDRSKHDQTDSTASSMPEDAPGGNQEHGGADSASHGSHTAERNDHETSEWGDELQQIKQRCGEARVSSDTTTGDNDINTDRRPGKTELDMEDKQDAATEVCPTKETRRTAESSKTNAPLEKTVEAAQPALGERSGNDVSQEANDPENARQIETSEVEISKSGEAGFVGGFASQKSEAAVSNSHTARCSVDSTLPMTQTDYQSPEDKQTPHETLQRRKGTSAASEAVSTKETKTHASVTNTGTVKMELRNTAKEKMTTTGRTSRSMSETASELPAVESKSPSKIYGDSNTGTKTHTTSQEALSAPLKSEDTSEAPVNNDRIGAQRSTDPQTGIPRAERCVVETENRPTKYDSQPTEGDSYPAETESQPAETDSQPAETDSQPSEIDNQPSGTDSHPAETDSHPVEAESAPVGSPRIVASIRSLLRHLSPVSERRRAEGDSRDSRDGPAASPRVKRFPKFWSHHSRRDRKSPAVPAQHDSTAHVTYPQRSGKLNILTRQRPFALATTAPWSTQAAEDASKPLAAAPNIESEHPPIPAAEVDSQPPRPTSESAQEREVPGEDPTREEESPGVGTSILPRTSTSRTVSDGGESGTENGTSARPSDACKPSQRQRPEKARLSSLGPNWTLSQDKKFYSNHESMLDSFANDNFIEDQNKNIEAEEPGVEKTRVLSRRPSGGRGGPKSNELNPASSSGQGQRTGGGRTAARKRPAPMPPAPPPARGIVTVVVPTARAPSVSDYLHRQIEALVRGEPAPGARGAGAGTAVSGHHVRGRQRTRAP